MVIKNKCKKNMTIKRRLAISNLLMILVPVTITSFIASASVGLIWHTATHSTGLGFENSEDFYRASQSIAMNIENALVDTYPSVQSEKLESLSKVLDLNSTLLVVDSSDTSVFRYGQSTDADALLLSAVDLLGGEGFVSDGSRELYVYNTKIEDTEYRISVFATPVELSYNSLKFAIALSTMILMLTVLFSIIFTNRFLTKFVLQKIEQPLDILSDGVHQISEGNLQYRIKYTAKDEFAPICADFNEMAARLEASVNQLHQHEQSRKELLVGVSHDLRSPLTSIRAYVEGLLDGVAKTPEAQERYLVTIKNKAHDIDQMLAKLFLFSKLELGEYSDNPELLRLDDEIRQLVSAVDSEYSEKGLIISIETLTPAIVSADPDQLRGILINIMENSQKYKIKEVGNLTISIREEIGGYKLSLHDDGPGVPEDALPHLFEVFYRSDPSRQNPNRGSGLGLAIVATAVSRMNGTIKAKNSENGGLEIVIWLPKAGE